MSKFETYISKKFNIDATYFVRGSFLLSSGQMVAALAGLTLTTVLASQLTESDFGTYRYLITLSIIFSLFSLTGLGQSILQSATKGYHHFYHLGIKRGMLFATGISITGTLGGMYYLYNGNQTLALGCLLIALIQPFVVTFQNINFYLQGTKQFKKSTKVQIIKSVNSALSGVIVALLTENILFLFFTYLFSQFLINLISHAIFKPQKNGVIPEETISQLMAHAKHSSLRNIIGSIAYRVDSFILFTYLGAVELAVYTIANIIPEQIKGLIKSLSTLIFPKIAQYSEYESIKKSVLKRSVQLFFLISLATIAYSAIVPVLYTLLFPKYTASILYSQLAALAFPALVSIIPMSVLTSHMKNKQLYNIFLISSGFSLVVTFLLIFTHGLLGAVIAKICSRYLTSILTFYIFFKR